MKSPAAKKLAAKRGIRTGACGAGMHDYCPANHTPQSCACTCHEHQEGPNGDPQVTADDH